MPWLIHSLHLISDRSLNSHSDHLVPGRLYKGMEQAHKSGGPGVGNNSPEKIQ